MLHYAPSYSRWQWKTNCPGCWDLGEVGNLGRQWTDRTRIVVRPGERRAAEPWTEAGPDAAATVRRPAGHVRGDDAQGVKHRHRHRVAVTQALPGGLDLAV